jgi:hypothetical protein
LRPIEELRQEADIREREQARSERGESSEPDRPVGEHVPPTEEGVHKSEEPGRTDLGGGAPLDPNRRVVPAGEGAVQPELGRVPGLLETKLSAGERRLRPK